MKFSCPLFFLKGMWSSFLDLSSILQPFANCKTFHIHWILMKLNKYQNDTQIPLALFLQVLVLHLVHNFLFIRILKICHYSRAFTKSQEYISSGHTQNSCTICIVDYVCVSFCLMPEQLKTSKSMKMAGSYGPPP